MVAELIDQGNRQFVIANSKKGTQAPKPLFIPRPGRVVSKRPASAEELKAMFGKKGIRVVKKQKE